MKLIACLTVLPLSFLVGAVPTAINYQGRLTDTTGEAIVGSKEMSIKIFDAAVDGKELYGENIGTVSLNSNGLYHFEFGANGQSVIPVQEVLAETTSNTTYDVTLDQQPVEGSLSISDGTNNWDVNAGNPGSQATATAEIINGFIVGITVVAPGEAYSEASPPTVTVTGIGSGATATAIVSEGSIVAINVTATGTGYIDSTTISIAPPPSPYQVFYDSETNSAQVIYSSASAGRKITAVYQTLENSIVGALTQADASWLELTIDGAPGQTRERLLSVPFAQHALNVEGIDFAPSYENLVNFDDNKIYQARDNGFVVVSDRRYRSIFEVWLGSSPDNLARVSQLRSGSYSSSSSYLDSTNATIPVPKGYYFKTSGYSSGTRHFISFGDEGASLAF